jgi:hypothetical protein
MDKPTYKEKRFVLFHILEILVYDPMPLLLLGGAPHHGRTLISWLKSKKKKQVKEEIRDPQLFQGPNEQRSPTWPYCLTF